MADEFETGFLTAKPAWHGKGVVLSDAPNIEEAIAASGTDWQVVERPLYVDLGQKFGEPETLRKNDLAAAHNVYTHKALVRSSDNRVLGVVGKDYHPVQNVDAFRWFDFLLESKQAKLEAGGSLREGQRVWVLAKMTCSAGEVVRGDRIDSYLLLSNSHSGDMGVWLVFTPIRVVCMNTLTAALEHREKDARAGRAISLRHTPKVAEQLQWAQELVDASRRTFDASLATYRLFQQTAMSDEEFGAYFDRVYYGPDKVNVEKEMEPKNKKKDNREKLRELFEAGTGMDIEGVRGTVWAGYNAVTEFVDHYRSTGARRLEQSWYGEGSSLRSRAFAEALEFVKANR